MHVRGEFSNSMLLMTPWESVHKGNLTQWDTQDYSSIESGFSATPLCPGFSAITQRQGLNLSAEYFTKQQCIKCGEYGTICPNLLCNPCCEMEMCGCLAIIWELNPTKGEHHITPRNECRHQNLICPNGWILIDYRENCWCDLCHERVCLDKGSCDENCGCQQWLQAEIPFGVQPIILAMRASKGSPPRYSPVQQDGDGELYEGDLSQPQEEAFSPHGAESENSPLLPMRLSGRVERCANPDTGSVHTSWFWDEMWTWKLGTHF